MPGSLEAALTRMREETQTQEQPKRRRGRPPGSKNLPNPVEAAPKRRGPPGSKNKPKFAERLRSSIANPV
jgi:hypothetical protein